MSHARVRRQRRAGLFAQGALTLEARSNVVLVPGAAVRFSALAVFAVVASFRLPRPAGTSGLSILGSMREGARFVLVAPQGEAPIALAMPPSGSTSSAAPRSWKASPR